MNNLHALVLVAALIAGCPDSHGRDDASVGDGSIEDAGGLCTRDGVAIATVDGECSCEEHEVGEAVDDNLRVCPGTDEAERFGCAVQTCELGHVCRDYVGAGTARCMGAKECLVLHDLRSEPVEPWRCVYADTTRAVTGEVPEVVCDDSIRRRGLCGVNCPCAPGTRCYGPSEMHPIGACAPLATDGLTLSCLDGECEPGSACLRPVAVHDWYSEARFALGDGRPHGACVPIDTCEALEAEYPGVWSCS